MKNLRRVLVFTSVVVALWLALCAVIGIIAVEMALHPTRTLASAKSQLAFTIAASHHATLTDSSATALDGALLRGWTMTPIPWNGNTVILLHGQSDNRSGMLGYADLMLRHGYSVLLPDARAHGASAGNVATYGVLEADDIHRWLDLIKQTQSPRCIFGLGESMGAAQLLNLLASEHGFCAVVAESSFATFREASYDRLGENFNSAPWLGRTLLRPAVEAGFLYARLKYGIDIEQAAPEDSVAASSAPVLLIHGLKDTNLPPHNSELILAQSMSRGPAVVLWEPPNAGHTGAASADPAEFERRVIAWFDNHNRH
jgi:pimeloyl-ACP methyl ester carboxylesterase